MMDSWTLNFSPESPSLPLQRVGRFTPSPSHSSPQRNAAVAKIIALILMLMPLCAKAESTYLYTETSVTGETMDAFVLRIAPKAYSQSWVKAKELCGAIESSNGVMSVDFYQGTNNSCEFVMPEGSISIHTHPVAYKEPLKFSKADLRVGGYLVGRNKVMHADGRGLVRSVYQ